MRSNRFKLNRRDYFHGLLVAIGTATLMAIEPFANNGLHLDKSQILTILGAGISGGIAYILKSFNTNSRGRFNKKEL